MQKYKKKIELRCSLTPTARNRFQSISQSDSVVQIAIIFKLTCEEKEEQVPDPRVPLKSEIIKVMNLVLVTNTDCYVSLKMKLLSPKSIHCAIFNSHYDYSQQNQVLKLQFFICFINHGSRLEYFDLFNIPWFDWPLCLSVPCIPLFYCLSNLWGSG